MRRVEIERRLAMYLKAEEAILRAQSYKIGERELTRADLSFVKKMIDELSARLAEMERGRGSRVRVVFIS